MGGGVEGRVTVENAVLVAVPAVDTVVVGAVAEGAVEGTSAVGIMVSTACEAVRVVEEASQALLALVEKSGD